MLERIPQASSGDILAIGVDVAWWGGSKKSKESRSEAIAFSTRTSGKWTKLEIVTVDLNASFDKNADEWTPNADSDASDLVSALTNVIDRFPNIDRIIAAFDVPILALDRALPPPKKANAKGEAGGVYRQCDEAWMKARALSPIGWTSVNVLPGAPTVPRCKLLLQKLRELEFEAFGLCDSDQDRQIIECFPNEIVWSIGATGLAPYLRPDSLQQYKRLGKKNLPLAKDLFHETWRGAIKSALELAGASDALITDWMIQFETWVESSACYDPIKNIGFTGKAFDDAVESVLSLTASMALADGNAHIHCGNDLEDGHIIGPGFVSQS